MGDDDEYVTTMSGEHFRIGQQGQWVTTNTPTYTVQGPTGPPGPPGPQGLQGPPGPLNEDFVNLLKELVRVQHMILDRLVALEEKLSD